MPFNLFHKDIWDVRAVHFIKPPRNKQRKHLDPQEGEKKNILFCLGHFDYIETKEIVQGKAEKKDAQSVFKAMEEDCKLLEDYEFPMYLLRTGNELKKADIDSFWRRAVYFTAFVRMHCAHDLDYTSELQRIEKGLVPKAGDRGITSSPNGKFIVETGEEKREVSFLFYNPLDLGDVVAVLKSDSLLAILKVSLFLNALPYVRNTYTHCGIDADLIRPGGSASIREDSDQKTIYATTRFSLSDTDKVVSFLSGFNEKVPDYSHYYTTGLTDILIDWGEITEKDLITNLSKTIEIEASLYSDLDRKQTPAFDDVVTRIGFPYQTYDIPSSPESDKDAVADIADIIKDLYDRLKSKNTALYKPAIEVLEKPIYTLMTMADNPVMDDFFFMVAPGVYALLVRLEAQSTEMANSNDYVNNLDEVVRFIADWTTLANDIESLENQVYQRMELSPVRYYIPVTLLRFEQQFVYLGSSILGDIDDSDARDGKASHRKFMPMVIATQERNASTNCPLDPRSEQYTNLCPLQIYLPVEMMFQPWSAAIQLTHEVAHYSGDVARNREKRRECLIKCAAHYILCNWALFATLSESDVINGDYCESEKMLQGEIESALNNSTCNIFHLDDLVKRLSYVVGETYSNRSNLKKYEETCLALFGIEKQLFYANRLEDAVLNTKNTSLGGHLNYLRDIFYESYADIAMLLLLNCTFHDYYTAVYQTEFAHIKSCIPPRTKDFYRLREIKRHIDRAALVADTMNWVRPRWFWSCDCTNQGEKEFFDAVHEQLRDDFRRWNSTGDDSNSVIYRQELDHIQSYLRECASVLKERLSTDVNRNDIQKIRRGLRAVSEKGFDWKMICQFLTEQEKYINRQIQDTEQFNQKGSLDTPLRRAFGLDE